MKTYTEKAREIPVAAEVDVLVAGGGPAGFAAAYTAAKNGASVLLIEQGGDVGGMSTIGLMSHWVGRADSKLYHEILRRRPEPRRVSGRADKADQHRGAENAVFGNAGGGSRTPDALYLCQ